MEWISIKDAMPDKHEWVLVWNKNSQLAFVAKWNGKYWHAVANNTKLDATTHWQKIIGPNGERNKKPTSIYDFTNRDSQNS